MQVEEKRQSKRKDTNTVSITLRPMDPEIWFKYWDGLEFRVRDLSLVGVGLYSREILPQGTPLTIDIRLGDDSGNIRIFGRVVWVEKEDCGCIRTGVGFSWWKDDADRNLVNNFLNN